jgi:GNAT superfamily N-acetyltransferase
MASEAERIERAALTAQHACADEALRHRLGLQLVPVGDGIASVAAALPVAAVTENRLLGLGLDRPIRAADIAVAAALYRDAGVARFFLHLYAEARTEAVTAALAAAGLEQARAWRKFEHRLDEDLPPVPAGFEVREIGAAHAERFARIVCAGFDLGDAAIPWFARLPGREGWHAFMAFDGTEPVGAGALFVEGEVAWTDFGATDPAHRGRGAQRANLVHRLHAARALGCSRAYTCTGAAVPGDPQHSYRNILRAGFAEAELRENWAPPKAG